LARLLSPASFGFFIVVIGRSEDGGFSLTVASSSGEISYLGGPEKLGFGVGFVVAAGGRIANPDGGRGGGGVIADGAVGGGSVIPDDAGGGGGGGVIPDTAGGGGGGGDVCWGGDETHPGDGANDWNGVGASA